MPYKDLEQRRAAKQKSAAKRRNADVCSRCSNKRKPGDTRCPICGAKQRAAERKASFPLASGS